MLKVDDSSFFKAPNINDTKTYEKIISETKEYSNEIFYITDYPNILCSFDIKKFIKI